MSAATYVESLRRAWAARAAELQRQLDSDPYGRRDDTAARDAEQSAWDAFRAACDDLNGASCNHAECPQPSEGDDDE